VGTAQRLVAERLAALAPLAPAPAAATTDPANVCGLIAFSCDPVAR